MNYDSRVEDSNGKSVKTVMYGTALNTFRQHILNTHKTQTKAAQHYGVHDSYISEIVNMSNNRVMTNEMLADIGMRWCSVITKK